MNSNNNNNKGMPPAPAWLRGLMAETTFFGNCTLHLNRRKNEKNIFCLRCSVPICPHCLLSHPSHALLQVRRYVYHDVIRLGDLEKLIDCSYIQPYTINGAKVIFLHQRPQSRTCKGSANICFNCDRILQEPFHFCSLSCKVNHLVYHGEDLSHVLQLDESEFATSGFEGLRVDSSEFLDHEDGEITPDSILENPLNNNYNGSSCSSGVATDHPGISREPHKFSRKKTGSGFLPRVVLSLSNRRKGAPQRAPLS